MAAERRAADAATDRVGIIESVDVNGLKKLRQPLRKAAVGASADSHALFPHGRQSF
jgi:hypothetical protein